jgi:PQQ-like domain
MGGTRLRTRSRPDERGPMYVPESWLAGPSRARRTRVGVGRIASVALLLLAVGFGAWAWMASGPSHRAPGRVTARLLIGGKIAELATGFGSLWVADDVNGQIVRVDPVHRIVVARIDAPRASSVSTGLGAVWANGDGTLLKIDAATNRVVRRVPIETPDGVPYKTFDVVPSKDGIWLVTPALALRLDPGTLAVRGSVALSYNGVWPVAWASARGGLWVLSALGQLRLYEWRTGRLLASLPSPVSSPGGIVASGRALVVLSHTGDIARVDPHTGRPLWRTRLRAQVSAAGARGGLLFAKGAELTRPRDLALQIDLADGHVASTLPMTELGSEGRIAAVGREAWIATPGGKLIAVRL